MNQYPQPALAELDQPPQPVADVALAIPTPNSQNTLFIPTRFRSIAAGIGATVSMSLGIPSYAAGAELAPPVANADSGRAHTDVSSTGRAKNHLLPYCISGYTFRPTFLNTHNNRQMKAVCISVEQPGKQGPIREGAEAPDCFFGAKIIWQYPGRCLPESKIHKADHTYWRATRHNNKVRRQIRNQEHPRTLMG